MRAQTRHQLKQDTFSRVTIEAAEKTAHWSVEHRNTLVIAVVVLLVIAAAGVGGWYYLSAQNEKASLDMTQAIRTLEAQIRPAGSPAQPGVPSFTSAKERAEAAKKQFQIDYRQISAHAFGGCVPVFSGSDFRYRGRECSR